MSRAARRGRGGDTRQAHKHGPLRSRVPQLASDLETRRAAVANQLLNTRLRAIELERKIKETLQKRLSKLQAVLRSLLCSCWFLCSSSESESKKEAMRCLKRYIARETYRARSLG